MHYSSEISKTLTGWISIFPIQILPMPSERLPSEHLHLLVVCLNFFDGRTDTNSFVPYRILSRIADKVEEVVMCLKINALVALHSIQAIVSKSALRTIHVALREIHGAQDTNGLFRNFAVEEQLCGGCLLMISRFGLKRSRVPNFIKLIALKPC